MKENTLYANHALPKFILFSLFGVFMFFMIMLISYVLNGMFRKKGEQIYG